jgi:hypothetical protein
MDPRTIHAPGVNPMDPAEWLLVHPDYPDQIAEHDALLDGPTEAVIAAPPEAADIVAEFGEALLAHLAARPEWRLDGGGWVRPDGARVAPAGGTLALAGRLCAEDFLLMAPDEPEYRLAAGALFFPSRWTLAEKMGRQMTRIHAPVPGYAETLAARLRRMFAAIRVGAPLMRVNWNVVATPALRLPMREGATRAPDDPSAGLWLRTERQSLVRLPVTRALVFAIKTTVTPLADLTAEQRSGLRAALAARDEAEVRGRGGTVLHAAALAALAEPGNG